MRSVVCKNFSELKDLLRSYEPGTAYIVNPPSSNGEIVITFLTEEDIYELPPALEINGTLVTRQ